MLESSHRQMGAVLVVTVRGEMRLEKECSMLEAALGAATTGRSRCILLDLSHATDLSSRGLGLIVEAIRAHTQRGGVFKICGVPSPKSWLISGPISPDTLHLPVADALRAFSVEDCRPLPEC